jgi:hypothetical protein
MKSMGSIRNKYNNVLSEHVTRWFHQELADGTSPENSMRIFNNRLLQYLQKWKLELDVVEEVFRRYMCEALCTMYVAAKQKTSWFGPHSSSRRPRGWNSRKEKAWQDYIGFHYFTHDFWTHFWEYMPESSWEHSLPDWRNAFQNIVTHYVTVRTELIDDECNTEEVYVERVPAFDSTKGPSSTDYEE